MFLPEAECNIIARALRIAYDSEKQMMDGYGSAKHEVGYKLAEKHAGQYAAMLLVYFDIDIKDSGNFETVSIYDIKETTK